MSVTQQNNNNNSQNKRDSLPNNNGGWRSINGELSLEKVVEKSGKVEVKEKRV